MPCLTKTPVVAAGCLAAALMLSACSSTSASTADGPIEVKASDTHCELSRTTAPAGTLDFTVTNTGTKVTEFYLLAEGDRIVSEVENITPGLSREMKVEITQPGSFTTACKPGMIGDGIRGAFEVTGQAQAAADTDERLRQAIADYRAYVTKQADEFQAKTQQFVDLVTAGKVEQAKALYPQARTPWERIEPIAESFGELDPRVDGREADLEPGASFTGYHRLEKDLWVSGLQPDSAKIANQLMADVTELVSMAKQVEPNALRIATGAKALLDEVATGKITGEEEAFSHTDLWDFQANVQGSQAALLTLRPVIEQRDPALQLQLDERFAALNTVLQSHRQGTGFRLYTELNTKEIQTLQQPLDAISESVAKVPAVLDNRN